MPRSATTKPWLHQASGNWCATVNGRRVYLDRNYDAACRKLRQTQVDAKKLKDACQREWLSAPLADLADEYLNDVKARRAPGTYRNYRERLLRAMKIIGPLVRVVDVRRIQLAKIEQQMAGHYSPATIRDTIEAVQQVFAWAVRHDLLETNPVAGYRKPSGRPRTRLVTPDEFQALLRACDPPFRRFLITLRQLGCRPGELRDLTWEMVDLDRGLCVLPTHKTVTMQREPVPRVIPLSPVASALVAWLAARRKPGQLHVFTNTLGKPYTKACVVTKMARVRKRAGIERVNGENLVLYSNRHTYCTNAVGRVSDSELAQLVGHTTTRTLRHYIHLNADHLKAAQRRALGLG